MRLSSRVSFGNSGNPIWTMKYDTLDRVTERSDPRGMKTVFAYNERTLLDRVTRPDPDFNSATNVNGPLPVPSTQYVHTRLGELDDEVDHLRRKTDYSYDRLSHLTRAEPPETDPFGKVIQSTYADAGNLKTLINRRNQKIERGCDGLNRPTSEVWTTTTRPVSGDVDRGDVAFRADAA